MFKAILGSIKNAEPKQCGYDHNWMFNNSGDLKALAPQVSDPDLAEHDRGQRLVRWPAFHSANVLSCDRPYVCASPPDWNSFAGVAKRESRSRYSRRRV